MRWTGDYRFEAHSIVADVPNHYDGMRLQNLLVNTMFYAGAAGRLPANLTDVDNFIRAHYADYLYFTNNLTFDQVKQGVAQIPPASSSSSSAALPAAYTRLQGRQPDPLHEPAAPAAGLDRRAERLVLRPPVDVQDVGRLDRRPGVQRPGESLNVDGTTATVPNSDILRVERVYFSWNHIGGTPLYLSIGRRPSTDGAPLNLRQDEPRGGTPLGSLINYQFDGITAGYSLGEHTMARLCYGLGYEAGFGSGDILKLPQDRLKDAHFLGVNLDIWDSDTMMVQTTVARAYNVTDGFNGLVVLPNNPVTGQPIGAPLVMRFTPSANVGDLDLGGLVFMRKDGPLDWFASYNFSHSNPNGVTTPFGGFFSDPFEVPTSHTGQMVYVGARATMNEGRTKIGAEYNQGSKYWLNFNAAEDDIIAPKTSARGKVVEAYLTHRISPHFIAKVDFIKYWYDYSLSGWQLGAPQALDETPTLGYPSYLNASKVALSMIARF